MKSGLSALLLSAFALWAGPAAAQSTAPFDFVAIGDMPYNVPGDYEKFDRLIDAVNTLKPAFTLHVGDMISGVTACSDENFLRVKASFDRFHGALVLTPGDNDWTDCLRALMGKYDPMERLAFIRKVFFADPVHSMGKTPMTLEPQSRKMAGAYAAYVENVRFTRNSVHFAAVHVVGSLNNFDPAHPERVAEYQARNAANIAWIDDAFQLAMAQSAKGLVLFWQANVHATPRSTPEAAYAPPFRPVIEAVERGAAKFRRPVLVIYGDYHAYDVKPFENMARQNIPGVTRVQVFGDRQVHAVRIRVDPASKSVFEASPLIIQGNGTP